MTQYEIDSSGDRPAPQLGQRRILAVDDDAGVRRMLARYLAAEGFVVNTVESGRALREELTRNPADLVLLDVGLPGEDGFSLARDLRASDPEIAIIMITGRSDVVDRVVGLEIGADDYIAKPFVLREVLARIKAVLRRRASTPAPNTQAATKSEAPVRFAGWQLEFGRRSLTSPSGADVPLTTGEFDLLAAFASHPQQVLDRDRLMDLTRGRGWSGFDRSIDTHVSRLRKKIEADPGTPGLIKSVRGVGYIFTPKVERG